MRNSSITSEDLFIDGFSKELNRNDHPSKTKKGGVCLYFRESLPIKRRAGLELMQEMVAEIAFGHKKIFFAKVYRSLSQNTEQFKHFIMNMRQRERSYSLIIIGGFNFKTSKW